MWIGIHIGLPGTLQNGLTCTYSLAEDFAQDCKIRMWKHKYIKRARHLKT